MKGGKGGITRPPFIFMEKKTKVYKCKYSHCKHDSKDIKDDNFIKVGNNYYHNDCYEEKELIAKIIDIFMKEVNSDVVVSGLRRVINDIVYNKGKSAEYLLFGLKYFIKNKKLNYPAGLYYVIQDRDVLVAWEKECRKKIDSESNDYFIVRDNDVERDNNIILPKKKSGFESIIGA